MVEFGASSGTATLSDAYLGLTSELWGRLPLGKQVTLYDNSGIGRDYQFGFTSFYEQDNAGEQVIKYKVDKGNFYAGIAYLMNSESGQTDGSEGFDANIGARVANLNITVYYADMRDASNVDTNNVNVELRYQPDALELSVAYAITDSDAGDTDSVGLTAVYQLNNNASFAAGWAGIDSNTSPDLDNHFYANTAYTFNDYIEVYAEIGADDSDDSEVGYATGMIVAF